MATEAGMRAVGGSAVAWPTADPVSLDRGSFFSRRRLLSRIDAMAR